MYAAWFGLSEPPFAITPDPRYLYLSARHSEALAHLVYALTDSGGFMQLTGEVGTGKTTLVRTLLQRLPEGVDVALVLNPRQSPLEFVRTICEELKVPVGGADSVKDVMDALNRHLLESHSLDRRTVVIVDEAQALPPDVLEQLRLLTNLETATHKLLQIVLVGQPELRDTLARHDLRQLAQRITARWHLEPLDRRETAAYVRHRLEVAGASGQVFSPSALAEVHRATLGVPRLINAICDRALLGAFAQQKREIDGPIVNRAAAEVLGNGNGATKAKAESGASNWGPVLAAFAAAVALGALVGGAFLAGRMTAPSARQAVPAPVPEARGEVARTAAAPVEPTLPAPVTIDQPAPSVADAPAGATPSAPGGAAEVDLSTALAGGWIAADTDSAFTSLFTLWRQRYQPGPEGAACAQAESAKLRCHYLKGNWSALRLLDRPAIITLEDGTGRKFHGVVRGLEAEHVTLQFGSRSLRVPLADVDKLWYGEALILWQLPPHGGDTLRPGYDNEGVRWLRRQLATLRGVDPATVDSSRYDAELKEWVRAFQKDRRFKADGYAGESTFVHLDSALPGSGTPTLSGGG
jgi:general secretion pathway protein A